MAKFRFRLATLQRLREITRDELRSKLAEAVQAQQILEKQAQQVAMEIEQLQNLRRTRVAAGQIEVEVLLEAQRYQAVLLGQQAQMAEQARLLAAEIERRRTAVVEADRQVKVLEKLRDRQLGEYRQKQLQAETKLLDEVASRCGEESDAWPR